MTFETDFPSLKDKGQVMVGEPNETGWYEKEGYTDKDGFYVVDKKVVYDKEIILNDCLDKERVRQIIQKHDLLNLDADEELPTREDQYVSDVLTEILKELGL